LAKLGTAKEWNFVHVVVTDGFDTASKSSLEETCALMRVISQKIPVEMLKTWFIGVNIAESKKALTEIAALVSSGGKNCEFANITDNNIEDIFSKLRVELGLIKQTDILAAQLADQGLYTYEENIPYIRVHKQRYIVLFNLDISGSMAGVKWSKVCTAVNDFVRNLGPEDLVCAILFNDFVTLLTMPNYAVQGYGYNNGAPPGNNYLPPTYYDSNFNLTYNSNYQPNYKNNPANFNINSQDSTNVTYSDPVALFVRCFCNILLAVVIIIHLELLQPKKRHFCIIRKS